MQPHCRNVAFPQETALPAATPADRDAPTDGRPRLLPWPDTFTDHFDPVIAADAVAVLEALGYAVELPPRTVCCGLTWTTTGQVDAARRVVQRSLRTIEPWLAAGVPVVGLEPSCTAALRTDGPELLPDEPLAAPGPGRSDLRRGAGRAHRCAARRRDCTGGRALVQVHCHQHAELGTDADRAVLAALGVQAEVLDSGCCGLPGTSASRRGTMTSRWPVPSGCCCRRFAPPTGTSPCSPTASAAAFSCASRPRANPSTSRSSRPASSA